MAVLILYIISHPSSGSHKVCPHSYLTSELDGGDQSVSRPGHFTLAKTHWHPLKWRLCGPQSWSGHFRQWKCSSCTWIRTPNHPACSLIPILTTLHQLHALSEMSYFRNLEKRGLLAAQTRFCGTKVEIIQTHKTSNVCLFAISHHNMPNQTREFRRSVIRWPTRG